MFIQSDYEFCEQVFDQFDQLNFCSLQYSDYRAHDQKRSTDPDNNFYNYISSNCKHYSEHKFNGDLNMSHSIFGRNISFTHLNSRSLNANFENICIYLESLNTFSTSLLFLKHGLNSIRLPGFNYQVIHLFTLQGITNMVVGWHYTS